jgi:hypothetical protein
MGVVGLAAFASADTVTATFNNVTPDGGVGCTLSYPGFGPEGTVSGQLNFSNASGSSDLGSAFGAFCCDIPKNVGYGGTYTWTTAALKDVPQGNMPGYDPMGQAKANQIEELWGRFHSTLGTDDTKNGGFQLAIWTIIYGNGASLTGGSGSYTSGNLSVSIADAVASQTNTYLGALTGDANFFDTHLYALTGGENGPQDQIVPTPGSFALLGLGGLMVSRRRR